ncbi:unnamed protein product [Arctia plantaginis]|uniref:FP protein C-terminal domain-containing protein n=1 Tax=Arctia plantaginis TaxID=874455 RepID=A0A8S1A7W5_ARCPL|nr:unnamed protein product [Arctia plantaginis]
MTEPMVTWGCCTLKGTGGKSLQCNVCGKVFHHKCLGLDLSCELSQWTCHSCTSSSKNKEPMPARFNTNINVRTNKRPALQSPPNTSNIPITEDGVRAVIEDVMNSQMDVMLERLTRNMRTILSQELNIMREDIESLKNSMTFISNQYDDILNDKNESKQMIKALQDENTNLTHTVKDMSARINILEQHARANNLEIQCVPQKSNENLFNVVSKLGETVGCDIKEESITNCTRVMKQNNANNRPKSIIVQFSTPRLRDTFLAASITFNKSKPIKEKLNTSHLSLDGDKTPIYISEHLSPNNRALHAATRLKAKERGYKYVWIRNGRIYVKKNESSENRIIKDFDSLSVIT